MSDSSLRNQSIELSGNSDAQLILDLYRRSKTDKITNTNKNHHRPSNVGKLQIFLLMILIFFFFIF